MALGPVIDERHLAETDPGDHAADEARLFGQRQEGIERAARHQPEITGVERDRRVGQPVEHAVEQRRRHLLEDRLAGALAAHGIDHIGLVLDHRRAHVAEQLGRILQIGIDDQDLFAGAQIEPGGQRELVAMVARQVDRDQPRVDGGEALHHRPAVVARAVVDEEDFIVVADRRPGRARDAGMEQVETGGLIVAGDDDGQSGTMHGRAP